MKENMKKNMKENMKKNMKKNRKWIVDPKKFNVRSGLLPYVKVDYIILGCYYNLNGNKKFNKRIEILENTNEKKEVFYTSSEIIESILTKLKPDLRKLDLTKSLTKQEFLDIEDREALLTYKMTEYLNNIIQGSKENTNFTNLKDIKDIKDIKEMDFHERKYEISKLKHVESQWYQEVLRRYLNEYKSNLSKAPQTKDVLCKRLAQSKLHGFDLIFFNNEKNNEKNNEQDYLYPRDYKYALITGDLANRFITEALNDISNLREDFDDNDFLIEYNFYLERIDFVIQVPDVYSLKDESLKNESLKNESLKDDEDDFLQEYENLLNFVQDISYHDDWRCDFNGLYLDNLDNSLDPDEFHDLPIILAWNAPHDDYLRTYILKQERKKVFELIFTEDSFFMNLLNELILDDSSKSKLHFPKDIKDNQEDQESSIIHSSVSSESETSSPLKKRKRMKLLNWRLSYLNFSLIRFITEIFDTDSLRENKYNEPIINWIENFLKLIPDNDN